MIARETILSLEGITKRYGDAGVVGPVDLTIGKGEFLTLLGPSGCGKTTTLQIIAGLLEPTDGRVSLSGRDITDAPPPQRDMGLVFQNYALFPHKTIFDNVAFGLRMRKVARTEIVDRVTEMLRIVGLPDIERRLPDQLSGGQRQRVALARALVIRPTILLLDEPLSNLDAMLRKRMRHEIRELQQRLGITTIFVTHDQDEAFEMSDRVALLDRGRIAQIGTPEELYDAPTTRFVAEFIGDANLIDAEVVSADGRGLVRLRIAGGSEMLARTSALDLGPGQGALLMIRPERIELADAAAPGTLPARVRQRVFSGERITLELDTSGGPITCTKPSLPQYRQLDPGMQVWLQPGDCRALRAS
ncbi:MAG: ABC transporter ATP-binding protein [Alphaproteobacteria bacterium]|jgi:ABC-type Fe3+/spermidine/putrescine transport system ATPase subunit|nr:ABC transporter ATP-binding protein [Alphaproteobacteria bacterium]